MLQRLSVFMQSSAFFASGNSWIFIGIAVAACILGVEVACIAVLIKKILQARENKRIRETRESDRGHSEYAAVLFAFASAPSVPGIVLTVLAGLVAAAALIFLILLIVFRVRGYDYVALGGKEDKPVAEPVEPVTQFEGKEPERTKFFYMEEEPEPEPAAQEEQPATEMAPVRNTDTPPAGNSEPVRIVRIEKQFTETVKEVQTPAQTNGGASDSSTDRLIEKLSDLIEKMDQQQEAASKKSPDEKTHPADGIAVGAVIPVEDDEEEDEDPDDDISEDSADESADRADTDIEEADDPEHFTGNERIIGFDEETGCYIVAHYRKSFEAKLIQSRPNIKQYYSELKNALLAYSGTKSRISWGADSYSNDRTPIAKINAKSRTLELYLALDPAGLDDTVYHGTDVGHVKKYADTPFKYKIRSSRKFKWAMELVERVCEEHGLSPIDTEKVDYEAMYPFEDTDSLVARGLIKEYIREEKPASTFELDETHVPSVPDVDETVIPANANISWEFDNERLSEKEPEPVEEPAPEPEPQPEPAVAPEPVTAPPASEPTVVRETTKTTQMRYTEQYYGDPNSPSVYKRYLSDEPFSTEEFFETPVAGESGQPQKEEQPARSDTTEKTVARDAATEEVILNGDLTEDSDSAEAPGTEEAEEPSDEAESELLSAFEADDRRRDDEDDLDWGIPTSLNVQTPYRVGGWQNEEAEDAGEPAETAEDALYEDDGNYDGEESETYADDDVGFAEGGAYDRGETAYAEDDAVSGGNAYANQAAYDENGAYAEDETVYAEDETYNETGAYDGEEPGYDERAEVPYGRQTYVAPEPARPKVNPDIALIDVCVLETNFPYGAVINLDTLKAKGLVIPGAKFLKVFATGEITKAFTVEADQFSLDAIRAIDNAGGEILMIKK